MLKSIQGVTVDLTTCIFDSILTLPLLLLDSKCQALSSMTCKAESDEAKRNLTPRSRNAGAKSIIFYCHTIGSQMMVRFDPDSGRPSLWVPYNRRDPAMEGIWVRYDHAGGSN